MRRGRDARPHLTALLPPRVESNRREGLPARDGLANPRGGVAAVGSTATNRARRRVTPTPACDAKAAR